MTFRLETHTNAGNSLNDSRKIADEIKLLLVKREQDLKVFAMLHLHKVSRNAASLLNYSRSRYVKSSRLISSCSVNFNVINKKHEFANGVSAFNLHKFSGISTCYQKHFFSTKGKSDEEALGEEEPEVEKLSDFVHTHLPATVAIPEVWPYLPCVATSRNPLFPRFMKILEVSRVSALLIAFLTFSF